MDFFRAYVEDANGVRTLRPPGARGGEHGPAGWATAIDPDDAVGRPDGPDRVRRPPTSGGASTVEAAVDDVRITRP